LTLRWISSTESRAEHEEAEMDLPIVMAPVEIVRTARGLS
jgi:hypothetical protein